MNIPKRVVLMFFSSLFFISIVYAQIASTPEETQNMKTNGDFGGLLLLSDDMNFFQRWHTTNTPGINLHSLDMIERNKPFQPILLFHTAGVNDKGLSNISADIRVLAPDGSIYGERKDFNCWKNLPAPPLNALQLCNDGMGIVIEDKDKAGRYTVEANLRDNMKGTALSLKQYFEVK